MKTKLLAAVLVVCMVFSLLPMTALAAEKKVNDDGTIATDNDVTVVLARLMAKENGKDVTNPDVSDAKDPTNGYATTYELTSISEAEGTVTVGLTATDLVKHKGGSGDGYWVGIGVNVPDGATVKTGWGTDIDTANPEQDGKEWVVNKDGTDTLVYTKEDGADEYWTYYFNVTQAHSDASDVGTIEVTDSSSNKTTTYKINFKVSRADDVVQSDDEIDVKAAPLGTATEADDAGGNADTYNATISGKTISIDATNLLKHESTTQGQAKAYWVGVAIPYTEGNTFAAGWGEKPGTVSDYEENGASEYIDVPGGGGKTIKYSTHYFNIENASKTTGGVDDDGKYHAWLSVKPADSEATTDYKIVITASLAVSVSATAQVENEDGEKEDVALTVAPTKLTAGEQQEATDITVSYTGYTVTITDVKMGGTALTDSECTIDGAKVTLKANTDITGDIAIAATVAEDEGGEGDDDKLAELTVTATVNAADNTKADVTASWKVEADKNDAAKLYYKVGGTALTETTAKGITDVSEWTAELTEAPITAAKDDVVNVIAVAEVDGSDAVVAWGTTTVAEGEKPPVNYTVSGTVAAGETGLTDLSNITVTLYKDGEATDYSAKTTAGGAFTIANVSAGDYVATVAASTGKYAESTANVSVTDANKTDVTITLVKEGGGDEGDDKPTVDATKVVAAPLVDRDNPEKTGLGTVTPGTVTAVAEKEDTYSFTLTGENLVKHKSGDGTVAYWVGVGLPQQEDAQYAWDFGDLPAEIEESEYDDPTSTMEKDGAKYDTLYWGWLTAAKMKETGKDKGWISVKVGGEVTATYEVTFVVSAKTYSVTVNEPANATVTTTPATLTGLEDGATVTITVKPAVGYEIASVKTAAGALDGTTNSEDAAAKDYTVTIDGANVDVTISMAAEGAAKSDVTVVSPLPTGVATLTTDVAEGTKVVAGDTVIVTATADSDHVITGVKATPKEAGDGKVDVVATLNEETGKWSFTMPAYDVEVTATVKSVYSVTVAETTNGTAKLDGEATKFAEGETVTINVKPADGYKVSGFTVTGGVAADDITVGTAGADGTIPYTFAMPAANATVTVTFAEITYTVTFNNNDGSTGDPATATTSGGKITPPTDPTREGYKFLGWGDSPEATTAIENLDQKVFTANTTLYAIWAKLYTITVTQPSEAGAGLLLDPSETKVPAGTKITVTVTPPTADAEAYAQVSVTSDVEVTVEDGEEDNTYTFTMPAADVTVSVTFVSLTVESTVEKDSTNLNFDAGSSGVTESDVTTAFNNSNVTTTDVNIDSIVTKDVFDAVKDAQGEIKVEVTIALEAAEFNGTEFVVNINPTYTVTVGGAPVSTELTDVPIEEFDEAVTVKIGVPDSFADLIKAALHYNDNGKVIGRASVIVSGAAGSKVAEITSKSFSPWGLTTEEQTLTVKYYAANGEGDPTETQNISFSTLTGNLKAETNGWAVAPGGAKKFNSGAAIDADLFNQLANYADSNGEVKLYVATVLVESAVTFTAAPANGTVVVKVDSDTITSGDTVTEGKTVTIEATPASGFKVGTVTLSVGTATKGSDGKYTFTMPGEAVTITVTFTEDNSGSQGSGSGSGNPPSGDNKPGDDKPGDDKPGDDKPGTISFTDVKAGDWFYDAVKYVYDNKLMDGTSAATFSPSVVVTRAQVAQVIYNMNNRPGAEGLQNTFTDVPAGQWYTPAVLWCNSKGYMSGYGNGTFGPNDSVTREQLALVFMNVLGGSESGDLSAFNDAGSTHDWALAAMKWAVGKGIISGKGEGKLDPLGTAMRSELAQVLMNAKVGAANPPAEGGNTPVPPEGGNTPPAQGNDGPPAPPAGDRPAGDPPAGSPGANFPPPADEK